MPESETVEIARGRSSTDEFVITRDRPILPNRWIWTIALLSLVGLSYTAWHFLDESLTLQNDISQSESSAVIGYLGLHPNLSYAKSPVPWHRREGSKIKLWGGWQGNVGHTWFTIDPTDLEVDGLGDPMGRDTFPAIDYPIVEAGGGTIWDRIPETAEVVGERLGTVDTAYPLLVLDKTMVVNDTVAGLPFLVIYNRFEKKANRATIFDPVVEGRRLTFSHTGYWQNQVPIFYDRGTESLWTVRGEVLASVSGGYKGKSLKQVGRPSPVSWRDWRDDHPRTRLLIGSDRNKTRPAL